MGANKFLDRYLGIDVRFLYLLSTNSDNDFVFVSVDVCFFIQTFLIF